MFSSYARREVYLTLLLATAALLGLAYLGWWIAAGGVVLLAAGVLAFLRDEVRTISTEKRVMVAPCDGKVVAVDELAEDEAIGGACLRVRIFMSLFNMHVNRMPCHARVSQVRQIDGPRQNLLAGEKAWDNHACEMLLDHPMRDQPLAVVRQVAGMTARCIVNEAKPGDIFQRGQRFGMIKFGSGVELRVPRELVAEIAVKPGDRTRAGETILLRLNPSRD